MKRLTKEEQEFMIKLYLSGLGAKESANRIGRSQSSCVDALRINGIPLRTNGQVHRKYHFNEAFFDTIDTEDKAYWLGFLTADGAIRKHSVIIALSIKDKEHLNKFRMALGSNHPIYDTDVLCSNGKKYPSSRINVNSMYLSSSLQKLGVTPNKSLTVKPCTFVPEKLLSHYWRGIFDGDGAIFNTESRPKNWRLDLVGSKYIVEGFLQWVNSFCKTKVNIAKVRNIYRIAFSKQCVVVDILNSMYCGSTVYLDRKNGIALDLIRNFNTKGVNDEYSDRPKCRS